MDIEQIIKNKSFTDLSANELNAIKDMANSEEEFNQIKSVLNQSALYFESNKIKASESMHAEFLTNLNPISPAKTSWLTSFFSFLFPADKSWFQYPALQFSTLILILFGVFTLFESPFKQNDLAVNTVKNKEIIVEEKATEKSDKQEELTELNQEITVDNTIPKPDLKSAINELEYTKEIQAVEPKNSMSVIENVYIEKDLEPTPVIIALEDELFDMGIEEVTAETDDENIELRDVGKSAKKEIRVKNDSKRLADSEKQKDLKANKIQSSISTNSYIQLTKFIQITEIKSLRELFFEVE